MSCAPTFSSSAVVRLRQRRLAEIERRRRDPRALAHDAFARALFGEASYGRASLGTTASVQRIDAADVGAFHDAHYRPETSYVGVAGSFDRDRIVELLEAFDPPSRGCATAKPPQLAPAVDPAGGVVLLDAPRAPHTEIRVGHLGVTRDCEDLPALDVLNAVLGGGPGSRLARSVRGRHGLAYHIRSRFIARRLGGMFSVETSVAHDAAATTLTAIRQEIERLRDELVPASEIEQARRRASGAALRFSQDLISAGVGLGPAALRKDSDYLQRRTHRVAHVEPTTLRELARRYLHPARLAAVLVGPAAALQSQFSSAAAHARPPAFESTS
jgi:zinc protease